MSRSTSLSCGPYVNDENVPVVVERAKSRAAFVDASQTKKPLATEPSLKVSPFRVQVRGSAVEGTAPPRSATSVIRVLATFLVMSVSLSDDDGS
jgi:hypothetical protein